MKFKDIKVGVTYLVANPWTHYNRKDKSPTECFRNSHLSEVTVTSLTKYVPTDLYTMTDPSATWTKAGVGEKQFGILVEDTGGRWFVVTPANVVGEKDVIEARWTADEAQLQAERDAERLKQEQRKQRIESVRAAANADIRGINEALQVAGIARGNLPTAQYSNGYTADRGDHVPEVTLPIAAMVQLIEKYLELKDQLED